jgi:hypothetical protein
VGLRVFGVDSSLGSIAACCPDDEAMSRAMQCVRLSYSRRPSPGPIDLESFANGLRGAKRAESVEMTTTNRTAANCTAVVAGRDETGLRTHSGML